MIRASTSNPYYPIAIRGQRVCYARGAVLNSLFGLIADPDYLIVVNLTGPHWIGKTAVLRCLEDPECFAQAGIKEDDALIPSDQVLISYIDLKDVPTANALFGAMADNLQNKLGARSDVSLQHIDVEVTPGNNGNQLPVDPSFDRLSYLLTEATRREFRVVFCLDHLDKSDLLYDASVRGRLEAIARSASLIVASRETLVDTYPDLVAADPAEWPFIEGIEPIVYTVSLLSRSEAVELLTAPAANSSLQLSPDDIDKLILFVGRQPYLLLHAARQAHVMLAESPRKREVGLSTNDIRARIEPVLRPYFKQLWLAHRTNLEQFHRIKNEGTPATIDKAEKDRRRAFRQPLQSALLIYEVLEPEIEFNYFSTLFETYVDGEINKALKPAPPVPAKRIDLDQMRETLGLRPDSNEVAALAELVKHTGQIIADDQLSKSIWGADVAGRTPNNTVWHLRKRLEKHAEEIPGQIVRHRNKGYSFEWSVPEA